MDCSRYRDVMSAELDGETSLMPSDVVERHRRSCASCRRWYAEAVGLARQVRVRPADRVPDLGPAIATRIDAARDARWWEPAWPWRVTLAVVGLIQIGQGLPAVFVGSTSTGHMARELGAWGVALGAGFLFAAWRPVRAAGLLPLVAALVAFLVVTTTRDVIAGNAGATNELSHLFEVFGLFLLWTVARFGHGRATPALRGTLRPA